MTQSELRLFNTLTRRKERFSPREADKVRLYACGPTVYDYAHIGNLRTYVFEDVLRRTLEKRGYDVVHVMNITDVGHLTSDADTGVDRVEMSAARRGESAWETAETFTEAFLRDITALNIKMPHFTPKATQHVDDMIEFVEKLERRGYTYVTSDGVYFDTSKLDDYGRLKGQAEETLLPGARIEPSPEKKDPRDFALWKLTPEGTKRQMEWDSPWGRGFPGWHIECSTLAIEYLGETIDIHCGGVDHIPIHHTNEIAQAEAVTGKQFVRFWFHCNHMMVEGERMAKSLGNFITLSEIEERGYSPQALRLLYMGSHYRSQQNFTWDSLDASQRGWQSLVGFLQRIQQAKGTENRSLGEKLVETKEEFTVAMDDDLNTPRALASMFEFVGEVNRTISKGRVGQKSTHTVINGLLEFDEILGLGLKRVLEKSEIPPRIWDMVQEREEARQRSDYEMADKMREEISKKGYVVEDTPDGPVVRRQP